jgi:hypothetical protein
MTTQPGDVLAEVGNVHYLFNASNCPDCSVEWLRRHSIPAVQMDGATHWISFDQPKRLAANILQTLGLR